MMDERSICRSDGCIGRIRNFKWGAVCVEEKGAGTLKSPKKKLRQSDSLPPTDAHFP